MQDSDVPESDETIEVDLSEFLPEGVQVAVEPGPPSSDDVNVELLTEVEKDLAGVDAALAALDAGTYGSCTVCHQPIDPAVLAEDPVAVTCANHQGG